MHASFDLSHQIRVCESVNRAYEFEIVWISSFSLCVLSWIERNIRIFITDFISHENVRNANTAISWLASSPCVILSLLPRLDFCPT